MFKYILFVLLTAYTFTVDARYTFQDGGYAVDVCERMSAKQLAECYQEEIDSMITDLNVLIDEIKPEYIRMFPELSYIDNSFGDDGIFENWFKIGVDKVNNAKNPKLKVRAILEFSLKIKSLGRTYSRYLGMLKDKPRDAVGYLLKEGRNELEFIFSHWEHFEICSTIYGNYCQKLIPLGYKNKGSHDARIVEQPDPVSFGENGYLKFVNLVDSYVGAVFYAAVSIRENMKKYPDKFPKTSSKSVPKEYWDKYSFFFMEYDPQRGIFYDPNSSSPVDQTTSDDEDYEGDVEIDFESIDALSSEIAFFIEWILKSEKYFNSYIKVEKVDLNLKKFTNEYYRKINKSKTEEEKLRYYQDFYRAMMAISLAYITWLDKKGIDTDSPDMNASVSKKVLAEYGVK